MAFSHEVDIDSNSGVIDTDLSTPLIIVDFRQAPAAFWTNLARTDGGDIQLFDSTGVTRYPFYILFIDTVNERGVGIGRPTNSLLAASDVTYRLKIGDATATVPAVTDTHGRNNVFQDYDMALNGMFEAASAPEIEDMTGNGYDGTITGSFAVTAGAGRFGQALQNTVAASSISINDPTDDFLVDEQGILIVTTKESVGNVGGDLIGWSGNTVIRRNNTRYQLRLNGTNYWRIDNVIPQDTPQTYCFNFDLANDTSETYVEGVADDDHTSVTNNFPTGSVLRWLSNANGNNGLIGTGSLLLWRIGSGAEFSETEAEVYTAMINDEDAAFWTWGTVTAIGGGSALLKLVDETVNVQSGTLSVRGITRLVASTVNISEASLRNLILLRAVSSTMSITEGTLRNLGIIRLVDEVVNIIELVANFKGLTRLISETVNINEVSASFKGLLRLVSEAVNINDSFLGFRGILRLITETININTSVLNFLISPIVKIVSETVNLAETVINLVVVAAAGVIAWTSLNILPKVQVVIDFVGPKTSGKFKINDGRESDI